MNRSHTPGTIHEGAGNGEGSIFTDTEGARRGNDGTCSLAPLFIVNGKTPEDLANARRLVAAWNACDGLDTGLLEGVGDGAFVRAADVFYGVRKAAQAMLNAYELHRARDRQPLPEALTLSNVLQGTDDSVPALLAANRLESALQALAACRDELSRLHAANAAAVTIDRDTLGALIEAADYAADEATRNADSLKGEDDDAQRDETEKADTWDAAVKSGRAVLAAARTDSADDIYRLKVEAGKIAGRALVSSLYVGQRLDLEADPIADPGGCYATDETTDEGGRTTEHPEFAYDFQIVANIERETADCIRVDFESGFSCGFPADHVVEVDAEQVRSPVPVVVIEIEGGLVNLVTSDRPARIVILDADTEGGDKDRIREVEGASYYVHDCAIDGSETGSETLDPAYCARITAALDA